MSFLKSKPQEVDLQATICLRIMEATTRPT